MHFSVGPLISALSHRPPGELGSWRQDLPRFFGVFITVIYTARLLVCSIAASPAGPAVLLRVMRVGHACCVMRVRFVLTRSRDPDAV